MTQQDPHTQPPLRVLIAGGGVAALEALLALRHLAGPLVHPMLLAPEAKFRFRPLSVADPFDPGAARELDLAAIALESHADFLCDGLAAVHPDRRHVTTTGGRELAYDALLIAIGARRVDAVPGALTFKDSADGGAFGELLGELEQGRISRLAFAVPGDASWPLGLYELALLTSARMSERKRAGVELTLITPESEPMVVFGRRASRAVGSLLERAGITVRLESKPTRFADGLLALTDGSTVACDRVVSLPSPEVMPIPGVPQQRGGFIPVDRFGAVLGLERVYAAGDATWFPVKQGGLATQQADCAASAIAARAGAPVDPQPFQPVLRGAILTEWGPRYMRNRIGDNDPGTAARSSLWWPPAKVAGKYLAPWLAATAGYRTGSRPLTDLDPPYGDDATDIESGHEDAVALALSSARSHAASRDFKGALRWLEVAEDLELYLPSEYELNRMSWQELAR